MSFADFQLSTTLQANLKRAGFVTATPVQQQVIPQLLQGADVIVKSATGSGKTAAFLLPLLNASARQQISQHVCAPRALVLVPTRELCQQVFEAAKQLAKGGSDKIALVYGGVPLENQLKVIKGGVDVLIATPGRLLDHLKKRSLRIDSVEFLVFDEADRMLDMGFEDEIRAICKKLKTPRQTALFSATLGDGIWHIAKSLMHNPTLVEIDSPQQTPQIEERIYAIDAPRKVEFICHLLKQHDWAQVLIFSRTKQGADALCQQLNNAGQPCVAMHADLSQKQRELNLAAFKDKHSRVLVATDVAARGLDIAALPCVINLELPFKAEDYVHRIGRTGRAGSAGLALTLLDTSDALHHHELEAYLDRRLSAQWYSGFEPDLTQSSEQPKRLSKAAQKQRARKRALANSK